jgi:ERCC4-related helicase
MLLDNEHRDKVYQWIEKYPKEGGKGSFDVVTGYFTIGALSWLWQQVNPNIEQFRMVLGEMVQQNGKQSDGLPLLDLINEELTIEGAFQLNTRARQAIAFLEQDKVKLKTMEPNFCHAKAYIYRHKENEIRNNFYISGSSNLTDAGIGRRGRHNIELNVGNFGSADEYRAMVKWFDELWSREEAQSSKTIYYVDDQQQSHKKKVDFKEHLIHEINRVFKDYTPRDIYYKILFELFKDNLLLEESDPDFSRQVGRLENTEVYHILYGFQKKGVLSLIRMLQKFNGAILADAVGLGKTWSALAVMKYYQMQGRQIILLCPKKLENNWKQYQKNQDSRFEKDQFEYFIRFHTDLVRERMESYDDLADKLFTSDKPKLLVIDESHNLRNSKGNRYQFLMNEILKKNEDIKVLMLSATPINNSLLDVRNQFSLMVKGNDKGFYDTLGIRNLYYLFQNAQRLFKKWSKEPDASLASFIRKLPPEFFTLTDSLTVARTRKMIAEDAPELTFPEKAAPENLFVTPRRIGNYDNFQELVDHFPPKMAGYQPSYYIKEENVDTVLNDEKQREFFLVKMMNILLVKRLESSWIAFQSTVGNILAHHQNAYDRIQKYQDLKTEQEEQADANGDAFEEDEELSSLMDSLSIGKKRPISLREIDDNGMLGIFKKDLKADIESLESLLVNVGKFEKKLNKETEIPDAHKSVDLKLATLITKIKEKQQTADNNQNRKMVIFTAYTDTATYLYKQLCARGFEKVACVSGQLVHTSYPELEGKKIEPVLERFAPFTKLFKGKEWPGFNPADGLSEREQYQEWVTWLKSHHPEQYDKLLQPVDILLATDVLSEGQNLQDADTVVNYDIHWNPVRVIQRMGRIDRIGSPNDRIFGINFWPTNTIDEYLNLRGRVERRMAAMKLAGAEVDKNFTPDFNELAEDQELENRQKKRMLEQMKISWDDIEEQDQGLGFDALSLEQFRQELAQELNERRKIYENMPNGVFSGFHTRAGNLEKPGLVALLGSPSKPPGVLKYSYKQFYLLYIDEAGEPLLLNQKEIMEGLTINKDQPRKLPEAIDRGEDAAINPLTQAVKSWLKKQIEITTEGEDGQPQRKAGLAAADLIDKIRSGHKAGKETLKGNNKLEDRFDPANTDLICWEVINAS